AERSYERTSGGGWRSAAFVRTFRSLEPTLPAALVTYGGAPAPFVLPIDYAAWRNGGFDLLPEAYYNQYRNYRPDLTVAHALRAAPKEARDPEVRAVVLTGAGRGFCAGQDLTEFGEAPDVGDALRATYHPNVLAIRSLEKPVIAAVNGVCAGAGVSVACVCDI